MRPAVVGVSSANTSTGAAADFSVTADSSAYTGFSSRSAATAVRPSVVGVAST